MTFDKLSFANITMTTVVRVIFTEIVEEEATSAGDLVLGITDHGINAAFQTFLSIFISRRWDDDALFLDSLARIYYIRCTLGRDVADYVLLGEISEDVIDLIVGEIGT